MTKGASGKCNCTPGYLPEVYDKTQGKKVRGRVCRTMREARDEQAMLRARVVAESFLAPTRAASTAPTEEPESPLWEDIATATADAIQNGAFLNRKGEPYKDSSAMSLVAILRGRLVDPDYGLVGRRLAEIRPHHIEALKTKLVSVGKLGPNSVCRHLDAIGVVWRYAYETEGFEQACPTERVRRPRAKPKRKTISEDTARKMLTALPHGSVARAVYLTALLTGMRRGELFGLHWEDIDLDAREIYVANAWNSKARKLDTPKSDESVRPIPIDDVLRAELIRWRLASGRSTGIVFSPDGKRPYDCNGVYRKAQRAWARAGVSVSGYHVCRRAFATFLASRGNDAFTIQRLMGHADISTTAMYISDRPAAKRRAVESLTTVYESALRVERVLPDEAGGARGHAQSGHNRQSTCLY